LRNNILYYISFILFLISCDKKIEPSQPISKLKSSNFRGFIMSKDSLIEPEIIYINEEIIEKKILGKANIITTHTNEIIAVPPKIVFSDSPQICAPGKDTFLLPEILNSLDSQFVAQRPDVLIAKEPNSNNEGQNNYYTYNSIHGISRDAVSTLMQDSHGNLWIATVAGGVTKFDGKNFTNYSIENGLSGSWVRAMIEDRLGNIWFGTNNGLTKYDGVSFSHISIRAKKGESQPIIFSLMEDNHGKIWAGTLGYGFVIYDGKKFINYSKKQGLPDNLVKSLTEDLKGNVWIATSNGLSKFDGKSFTNYYDKKDRNLNNIGNIFTDQIGSIWFTTESGLCKFQDSKFLRYADEQGLENSVNFCTEDKNGNIWISSSQGLTRFDGVKFTHFTEKEGLPAKSIGKILIDKNDNLWIGGNKGITNYFCNKYTSYTEKDGLINEKVSAIYQDSKSRIWFGYDSFGSDKKGISFYDGHNFNNYLSTDEFPIESVQDILEDKIGNIWFCTTNGLVKLEGAYLKKYTKKDGLVDNFTERILEDIDGNLWIATAHGVSKFDGKCFTNYTKKQGLIGDWINSIIQDKNKNIWFATSRGLSKFDGKFFENFNEKKGLLNLEISSIAIDNQEVLWIGTYSGIYIHNGDSIIRYTLLKHIDKETIRNLFIDRQGNVWFGTFVNGVFSLNPNSAITNKIYNQNLIPQNGFPDNGVSLGNSFMQTKDGALWVSGKTKAIKIHPNKLSQDTIGPNLQLVSLQLFNEDIDWLKLINKSDSSFTLGNNNEVTDIRFSNVSRWNNLPLDLSLNNNTNYLTFNFLGITLNGSKDLMYQYKLEGQDKEWSVASTRDFANYTNIPFGDYVFKVRLVNDNFNKQNEFNYKFTIRPPWYKTKMFISFIIAFILFSIIYYVKWRERKLKQRQKELEVKIEEATIEIKEKKHLIEEKHKEITDSINYAERIQRSFIATKEILDNNLGDYFVLFKPKDVVSGDFYWASKLNNGDFALATADSTGHGVPGAIMSLLNITSLEKAIETLNNPSEILNATRRTIIERLKKDGSIEGGKDGMDCSLICFNVNKQKINVAAANNPVWIARGAETIEIKPDKMPVGKHDRDTISFNQQEVNLQKGDVIYTLTDGFPDQFGGPLGKKFMSKNLRELISKNAHLPMGEQKIILETAFKNWVGDLEQIDDVTVIGIRV
jgi:ligand-binding sensor domain-containing protein/serine phosphatase RsbU (regulator of sigma subunit)